jgi:hypothetical protein
MSDASVHNYRDEAIVEMLREFSDRRVAEAHNLIVESIHALALARLVAAAEVARLRSEYETTREFLRV